MSAHIHSVNPLKTSDSAHKSYTPPQEKRIGSALRAIDEGSSQEPLKKRARIHEVDNRNGDLDTIISDAAPGAVIDMEASDQGKTDMFPYILCNEQNQERTIDSLKIEMKKESPGAHVGFSGWFNYDIIAATKSKRAVICDINIRMIEFYDIFQSVLISSYNRHQFIQNLTEALGKKGTYFDNGYLGMLPGEPLRSGSWLSTDKGFQRIKTLHEDNCIEYKFLNAAASIDKFNEIKEGFESQGIPIRTVYASNIFEWLEKGGETTKSAFKMNMKALIANETYYIDAYYPFLTKNRQVLATGTGPPLRLTKGDLPLFTRTVLDPRRTMQPKNASLFNVGKGLDF